MGRANANDKVRTLVTWEIPALASPTFIEMYINPNSLRMSEQKMITQTRTKGGFILQYWQEELPKLSIAGSCGDGGIESLNVLRDVYRSEQVAMINFLNSGGLDTKRRQSLAQMAASVTMWYQGQGHRGFFTSLGYEENAEQTGIITYTLEFTIVETIGRRKNYLPWQRKPNSTLENPTSADGRGSTTSGAYSTEFKMGELNAPQISSSGILGDSKFTNMTGLLPSQQKLLENLEENNERLTPDNLFAR